MSVMHFGDNTWININSDLISEYSSIYDTYEIDDEMIEYALDKNERAHMEYNRRTKTLVVIYNVLNLSKEENHYETIPLTFIVRQNQIVTISNSQNEYIIDAIVEELEENLHWNVFNLLLHSLFVISEHYFPVIEKLNKEQQNISKLLRKKTTKNNLFALSDLEIGGMYLVSATKQNAVVLEQLKTQQAFKEFDDFEREQLEDNIIEAKQLVEMTDLHLQILRQISGTYNNVLNNNLNDTMKFLTVISILMTIPDIVTGFFGMNVQIPLTELRYGWAIILFIIALGWMGALKVIQKLMKD
ncbi:magnesium transporter CorA family protein [Granulicatella adiacens ATCC 49175]|uniref:CorA-like protein n=1 Tax=Granulicatella adiacens ATCC 49175 TaxID=638301 RepID=C8NFW7_9LACT|nr:magnesium transporter CorA family protein [Granulicatella adiacens]MBF1210582.1 magnesium transporter CorA family protein [Granulicatella sp.]EEW37453.1 CorA-like protein [Granulicatella adiacens ATCC 49175]MCT2160697.1 magnesium transporter CorA family protein [Granulicatella adiacens]UAK93344.1 magnesium transporter CorA family protein [Granulicatella adiacens]UWP37659.1 magnesium transporter CorA family protein [Granulicatella adiacens ATCC 49175]